MKVTGVEIKPVVMAREDPTWRHALTKPGGEADVRGYLVKVITDEGLEGWGYAGSSAHYGVSWGGLRAALEIYGSLLKGRDPLETVSFFHECSQHLPGNEEALSAIDIALSDLKAKKWGIPLYQLWGGLVRQEIPIIRILAIKEPEEMAQIALKHKAEGYTYLKVKFSGNAQQDIARFRAIRRAVGEDIHLTVDMNQSYSAKEAIYVLKILSNEGVDLCEQPVKAHDLEGLAYVNRMAPCPIEAHESARTIKDVYELAKAGIISSINLNVQHLGGIGKTKEAAAICALGNINCRIQATGSRLLAAASLHLAVTLENIHYACELGEFTRLKGDPVEGLEVANGTLKVPNQPGIGLLVKM